jgi:hypothetical protein
MARSKDVGSDSELFARRSNWTYGQGFSGLHRQAAIKSVKRENEKK